MHPFIGMSQDEFLGSPVITSAANAAQLSPRELNSLADAPKEPFLAGRYSVKYGPSGAAVFDGSQVVASYNFGDTLVVNKRYRRQGIAAELVYQWRCRYPGPGTASTRTKAAQAIQLQVWKRIATEILGEKGALAVDKAPKASPGQTADNPEMLNRLILYHATNEQFDSLPDPRLTSDGGLHFGSIEQATMRTRNKGRRIFAAELLITQPRRSKDTGGNWAKVIKAAKAAGKDAIVYLNRYEGLTTEIIERLSKAGLLNRLDDMTDAQFRRAVPEATDSYIIFSLDQARWIDKPGISELSETYDRPKTS